MKNRLLLAIPLFLVISCSEKYASVNNGFDKICLIYTEVFNDPELKNNASRHEVVHELIKKYVSDVDAITAFVAVAQTNPDEKYNLFKQSAEYSLKRKWHCEVMHSYRD